MRDEGRGLSRRLKSISAIYQAECRTDMLATAANLTAARIPANAINDRMRLLSELLRITKQGVQEETFHQAPSSDLAIYQGLWKAMFHKNGIRELFNIKEIGAKRPTMSPLTRTRHSCRTTSTETAAVRAMHLQRSLNSNSVATSPRKAARTA